MLFSLYSVLVSLYSVLPLYSVQTLFGAFFIFTGANFIIFGALFLLFGANAIIFFFTPSTIDTHNTCAERGRARSGYHILKKFKAFLASSFVRGVLRSTTASVYKLFIRRFSRIQVS